MKTSNGDETTLGKGTRRGTSRSIALAAQIAYAHYQGIAKEEIKTGRSFRSSRFWNQAEW
jgi:hypothetical protein